MTNPRLRYLAMHFFVHFAMHFTIHFFVKLGRRKSMTNPRLRYLAMKSREQPTSSNEFSENGNFIF
jgi:hypothetical protein